MLQKLSHVTVWVLDQDRAAEFYTQKLGFEVRTDQKLHGFRWLTVGPKGQREIEMILLPITPGPLLDETTAAMLREVVRKGALCVGVLETADCKATHSELSKKGVEFLGPPAERPYGIEAVFRDDSGNYYSVVERPR